jgi:putative exporter of polyketide antibiotics
MIRKIAGVIVGYAIFAASAGLWFQLSHHPPHQAASVRFEWVTLAYGIFFAILAGFTAQLIARANTLTVTFFLAGVMFLIALISLLLSNGSHWTQLQTLAAFAPASILGGYLRQSVLNKK